MFEERFEVCAPNLQDHDPKRMGHRVAQASKVTVHGEQHIELASGAGQQSSILDTRPPKLLNRCGRQILKRPHKWARDALVNEKSATL